MTGITLEMREKDLKETFSRSAGPGGQHVNKVSTAVTLTHLPTGLSVTSSDSRSQGVNRLLARKRLTKKLLLLQEKHLRKLRAEGSKARRRLARRSPAKKRKLVEEKRRRSEVKRGRVRIIG